MKVDVQLNKVTKQKRINWICLLAGAIAKKINAISTHKVKGYDKVTLL